MNFQETLQSVISGMAGRGVDQYTARDVITDVLKVRSNWEIKRAEERIKNRNDKIMGTIKLWY